MTERNGDGAGRERGVCATSRRGPTHDRCYGGSRSAICWAQERPMCTHVIWPRHLLISGYR